VSECHAERWLGADSSNASSNIFWSPFPQSERNIFFIPAFIGGLFMVGYNHSSVGRGPASRPRFAMIPAPYEVKCALMVYRCTPLFGHSSTGSAITGYRSAEHRQDQTTPHQSLQFILQLNPPWLNNIYTYIVKRYIRTPLEKNKK